jgi:hypothetical protein
MFVLDNVMLALTKEYLINVQKIIEEQDESSNAIIP